MKKRPIPNAQFALDYDQPGIDIPLNIQWFNGRPIVRRVVDVNGIVAATPTTVFDASDRIDQVISATGWVLGTATQFVAFPYGEIGGADFAAFYTFDHEDFFFEASNTQAPALCFIVVTYSQRAAPEAGGG